jgi:hypothetical protein
MPYHVHYPNVECGSREDTTFAAYPEAEIFAVTAANENQRTVELIRPDATVETITPSEPQTQAGQEILQWLKEHPEE